MSRSPVAAVAATASVAALLLAGCAATTTMPTPTATAPAAACLRDDGNCLGSVPAGDYQSAAFNPFGTKAVGQLSYTLPAGWANSLDHTNSYWIEPADLYEANPQNFNGGVYVWADVQAALQDYPTCAEASDPTGPADAAGLAAWLPNVAGLTVTPMPSATLGSTTATVLDLELDPTGAPECSFGGFAKLVASRVDADDPYMWGISVGGERMRVWLVDLGAGHTSAIFIDARDSDAFDSMVPDATAIIESMTFSRL